jgi:hypothetical protein
MNDNLIFLKDSDLDRPVYRIFSFKRLEELFQEQKLTLVKPKLWDDPFENFILNATGKLRDGREFGFGSRNSYFGQCWSLTKESDAMWRIYSPLKDGVKVKTTMRKLFDPLFAVGGDFEKLNGSRYNLSSFIGKVKYSSTNTLVKMLKDESRMTGKLYDQSGWGQASTFFYKRWAFRHENEIRLIYNSPEHNVYDVFKFDIRPSNLIEQIVFDPRMSEVDFQGYRNQVISWGFNNKIIQSGLYKLKTFQINLRLPGM